MLSIYSAHTQCADCACVMCKVKSHLRSEASVNTFAHAWYIDHV